MTRVGIVGVFHETNTFSEHPTTVEAFRLRWYLGEQIVEEFAGSRTVGGGFLDESAAQGFTVVPVFACFAVPSGTITAEAFDEILDAISTSLAPVAAELDGVLLELHGDMDVVGVADPEAVIAKLVRNLVGELPVSAVLDFHANMAERRLDEVDVIAGYRENPHIDTYERGREATRHLARLLTGEDRPYKAHAGLAIVAPPVAQRTAIEPFASITARAAQLAQHPAIWAVNVHGGYAYLDASYTGLGFTAFADSGRGDVAEAIVEELRALAVSLLPQFKLDYLDADAAMDAAVKTAHDSGGPVVIADTGDNINGGSPGDTTWLTHAALRHPEARVLTTLCDPAALDQLGALSIGESADVVLGGWAGVSAGEPVEARVEILGRSAGVFVNEGPMSTGATVNMGEACWVRFGNVDVVIQRRATQPNDPQLFLHLGVDLTGYDVIALKGAAALRAGWAPYANSFVDAGTRGETDSVLERLPYRRFDRQIHG